VHCAHPAAEAAYVNVFYSAIMSWTPEIMVLLYQLLNLVKSEFGLFCLYRNSIIMCLYAPGVCSACRILVRLVPSLARVSARYLPSIFMWLGSQCWVG